MSQASQQQKPKVLTLGREKGERGNEQEKGKKVDGQVINSCLIHQQLNSNSNQHTITSTKNYIN